MSKKRRKATRKKPRKVLPQPSMGITEVPKHPRPLFKIPELWVAFATFASSPLVSWGLPMLIPSNPHNGLLIIIIGMIIGCVFLIRAYDVYKQKSFRKMGWLFILLFAAIGLITLTANLRFNENEQSKPILTLESDIISADWDEVQQTANVSLQFHIRNISESPSYQNRVRFAISPMNDPSNVTVSPDRYETNPVYKDTKQQANYDLRLKYGKIDNKAIFITRTTLKYSDTLKVGKGNWHEDVYWYALTIDFTKQRVEMITMEPGQILIYEPYIKDKYPDE